MPLQDTLVDVQIQGLSQKTDTKVRPQGTLEVADNVEFNKAGRLNKRRGYRAMDVSTADINSIQPPDLWTACAQYRNELLLISDELWSVVSPLRAVDGTAIILRGPMPRGGYTIRTVVSDAVGDETLGD